MAIINKNFTNFTMIIKALHQHQIIAYPTESVFGLGCDPDSKRAVCNLLSLKNRPWQKGLILVASHYNQLINYINDDALDCISRERMFSFWPGPITWVMPIKYTTPYWITGQHTSLAVRVSSFKPIQLLCSSFGKPLISTSANITGSPPARTANEVRKQLGNNILILDEDVEGLIRPSEIRDVLSGKIFRRG